MQVSRPVIGYAHSREQEPDLLEQNSSWIYWNGIRAETESWTPAFTYNYFFLKPKMTEGVEQVDLVADILDTPYSRRMFTEKLDVVRRD